MSSVNKTRAVLVSILTVALSASLGGCGLMGGGGLLGGASVEAEFVDREGYSFIITGNVPSTLNFSYDVSNSRPGEAQILPDYESAIILKARNTTAGRNASPPQNLALSAVYRSDSPACEYFYDSTPVGSYGQQSPSYCFPTLAYVSYPEEMEVIPEGKQADLSYWIMWQEIEVEEDQAPPIVESLNHPEGWVLIGHSYQDDSDDSEPGYTSKYLWVSPEVVFDEEAPEKPDSVIELSFVIDVDEKGVEKDERNDPAEKDDGSQVSFSLWIPDPTVGGVDVGGMPEEIIAWVQHDFYQPVSFSSRFLPGVTFLFEDSSQICQQLTGDELYSPNYGHGGEWKYWEDENSWTTGYNSGEYYFEFRYELEGYCQAAGYSSEQDRLSAEHFVEVPSGVSVPIRFTKHNGALDYAFKDGGGENHIPAGWLGRNFPFWKHYCRETWEGVSPQCPFLVSSWGRGSWDQCDESLTQPQCMDDMGWKFSAGINPSFRKTEIKIWKRD
ncbi:MAG: hypothetical protein FWG08_00470 [Propionibacteriaceae bacterium]|nr:hypothetical protein [Propionibacteriaceae bacterium]